MNHVKRTLHSALFASGRRPALGATVLCLTAALTLPLHAKDATTPADASGLPNEKAPLNAFAGALRPTQVRTAALQKTPYTPIRKQDDEAQIPEIEMFVGESRVFPAPGVGRIAVGNGQIMTAAVLDNKEVLIFANAVGTSSLFVWNEDGRYQRVKVNIVPGDTTRIAREVAAFLTKIPNTRASIVGDKVIVEGDDLRDADLAKIEDLAKRYPQIINFTNRLGWEQMVMLDVKVVEFPRNELRDLGLKWSSTGGAALGGIWAPVKRGDNSAYSINIATAQGAANPITNPDGSAQGIPLSSSLHVLSAINLGLNAELHALAQQGKTTILAEPQLSARNGAKATFHAGGEIPYSVSSLAGSTIIFRQYGVNLEIEPKVDRNGVIRATIKSEVSSLDPTVSTSAGPGLLSRKTSTEFNVRSGETIVLAGLIKRNLSESIDKVPGLGDIPVLGALFRSKRFQNDETELVVFVTPTVVDANSPGLVDRLARTKERLEQNLGAQPYLSNPLQPGRDISRPDTAPSAARGPSAVQTSAEGAPAAGATPVAALPGQPAPSFGPATSADQGSTLRVIRNNVILRAEPNEKSRALLELAQGAVVRLGSADPQPPGQGTWRNVTVGAVSGWILSQAVAPTHVAGKINTTPAGRIAATDQGTGREMLGSDTTGRSVLATTAHAGSVTGLGDSMRTPQQFRVAMQRLALRVTPDINAPVVTNLAEGQVVVGLAQPAQGYWTAVEADGKRGWAASQWLHPVMNQQ
jgi:pilus assembly protein CpaC